MQGLLSVSVVTDLAANWEADAEVLERRGDARGAALCRQCAVELREAVRADGNASLTLSEAALESGYSEDHLRHKVAEGQIPNVGRKGAPRIRRGDLPKKPNGRGRTGPSPAAAAADRPASRSTPPPPQPAPQVKVDGCA